MLLIVFPIDGLCSSHEGGISVQMPIFFFGTLIWKVVQHCAYGLYFSYLSWRHWIVTVPINCEDVMKDWNRFLLGSQVCNNGSTHKLSTGLVWFGHSPATRTNFNATRTNFNVLALSLTLMGLPHKNFLIDHSLCPCLSKYFEHSENNFKAWQS